MRADLADLSLMRPPPARRAEASRSIAIKAYTLVNGRLAWSSPGKSWEASLECQNLTDRLYYSSKGDGTYNGGGYAFGTPGLPRTVMFNVKRTF